MRTADHNALDDLIDLAAREMTLVEPARDLVARVTANLGRGPRARWPQRVAGAGVIAAALLLALWLPRIDRDAPVVSPPFARAGSPFEWALLLDSASKREVTGRTLTRETPRISADESAWLARALPPLEAAPPLTIDAIQPTTPAIAPISVEPFGPQPLELVPLDVRSSGGK